jgi:hypothetical protein
MGPECSFQGWRARVNAGYADNFRMEKSHLILAITLWQEHAFSRDMQQSGGDFDEALRYYNGGIRRGSAENVAYPGE